MLVSVICMDAYVMVYLSIYLIVILTISCCCYDAIYLCNGLYTLIELKQESSYAWKGLSKVASNASCIFEEEEENIT